MPDTDPKKRDDNLRLTVPASILAARAPLARTDTGVTPSGDQGAQPAKPAP